MPLPAGSPTRLGASGYWAAWSPDGETIAYTGGSDSYLAKARSLFAARADGSGSRALWAPPDFDVLRVGWSHDGRSLLVTYYDGSKGESWVAPDGSRLAFVGGRSADATDTVYLVSRDGGAPEVLSKPDPAFAWDPCWLPDGATLVWGNLDVPKGSIKAFDMRSRRISVIPGSQRMMGPKCSPLGTILADKNWNDGWWLYHPDAQRWEEIIPARERVNLNYPTWSRDGSAVYGLSLDERAVFRLTLPGLRPERVASLGPVDPTAPSQQPWMGLDPDDTPLVLRDVGMWDLYVLDWEAP